MSIVSTQSVLYFKQIPRNVFINYKQNFYYLFQTSCGINMKKNFERIISETDLLKFSYLMLKNGPPRFFNYTNSKIDKPLKTNRHIDENDNVYMIIGGFGVTYKSSMEPTKKTKTRRAERKKRKLKLHERNLRKFNFLIKNPILDKFVTVGIVGCCHENDKNAPVLKVNSNKIDKYFAWVKKFKKHGCSHYSYSKKKRLSIKKKNKI